MPLKVCQNKVGDTDALDAWELGGAGESHTREKGKGLVPVDEALGGATPRRASGGSDTQ